LVTILEIFKDDMYWIVDDKKLVIQATNKIAKHKEIPLGIVTAKGGMVVIKIDTLENVEKKLKLYIKDNVTRKIYSIEKNHLAFN